MNLIFITIDGARIDRLLNSEPINNIAKNGVMFEKMITYAPYTIAAMHAIVSGEYGFNNGVYSYWSTYKFRKNQFKTITEYLHEQDYFTSADIVSEIVIPKQGFSEFQIHDENKDAEMNYNWVGMPKEGFAFSRNYKVTIRAPKWEESVIKLNNPKKTIEMKMQY